MWQDLIFEKRYFDVRRGKWGAEKAIWKKKESGWGRRWGADGGEDEGADGESGLPE